MTPETVGDTIVSYEEIPKRPLWMKVLFQHRDPLEIPTRLWVEHSLKIGRELSAQEIRVLLHEGEVAAATRKAERYLSYRPRTYAEVRDYLRTAGYEADIATATAEYLESLGYIDDARYAQDYVEQMGSHMSRRQLAWKLRTKGLSPDIIAQTLDKDSDSDREFSVALSIARKYVEKRRNQGIRQLRAKTGAFLSRKGFPTGMIYRVLAELDLGSEDGIP